MKIVAFFLLLIFFYSSAYACPIDPWYRVANNYENFLENADVVFLGKLDTYEMESELKQIATFIIIKGFKGDLKFGEKIVVKNHHNTSCSRQFHPPGAAFYVFANNVDSGSYIIDGYATFVPMSVALETNMGLK
ncbi:hypothetical protein HBA55_19105 [Pseudomaricurvus alkylphenolicus]|uniref:hypothetical protein n=1 Tax=Pseudomaricurvus alkylphenolicus TaxID=1306991 RepID=UPI00141F8474|nr:hypothetical protein [Pseudomaricurvus alkylphenolicus]NIB41722.1 hypothetical protein [Pseudomaricurvus alkylphenolicus]